MSNLEQVEVGDLLKGDVFGWAGHWVTLESVEHSKYTAKGHQVWLHVKDLQERDHRLGYRTNEYVLRAGGQPDPTWAGK